MREGDFPHYLSFGQRELREYPYRVSRLGKAPSFAILRNLFGVGPKRAVVAEAWVREKRHIDHGERPVPGRQLTESVVSKPSNVPSIKKTEGVRRHAIESRSLQRMCPLREL